MRVDRNLVRKLRAVMPEQSPIDLQAHAENIAHTIHQARANAARTKAAVMRIWLDDHRGRQP